MNIAGYAHIDKNATTCNGATEPKEFTGHTCTVIEFDSEGGALVLNPQGTAMAMFDKKDIYRKFECGREGNIITPPNLDELSKMFYVAKCMNRKGGYNNLLSQMVIEASLMKGKFTDNFLWQLQ
jgi:hypothetical protein